jgi:hypothetical protein
VSEVPIRRDTDTATATRPRPGCRTPISWPMEPKGGTRHKTQTPKTHRLISHMAQRPALGSYDLAPRSDKTALK